MLEGDDADDATYVYRRTGLLVDGRAAFLSARQPRDYLAREKPRCPQHDVRLSAGTRVADESATSDDAAADVTCLSASSGGLTLLAMLFMTTATVAPQSTSVRMMTAAAAIAAATTHMLIATAAETSKAQPARMMRCCDVDDVCQAGGGVRSDART